jgi:hypothetical protein
VPLQPPVTLVAGAWRVFKAAEWAGDKIADTLGLNGSRHEPLST